MSTLTTNSGLENGTLTIDPPAPKPKTLTEMVLDIQLAQEFVSECQIEVEKATNDLSTARMKLALAVEAAEPLRKLFTTTTAPAKPSGRRSRGTGFMAYVLERTHVGQTFKGKDLMQAWANTGNGVSKPGMTGSMYHNPKFKSLGSDTFKRVA